MKAVVMIIAAMFAAVMPYLITQQSMTLSEWINVAVVALGSAQVYITKNLDGTIWVYAKLMIAAMSAGLVTFISAISDSHLSGNEIQQIVIAFFAALGVYATRGPVTADEGRHASP